MSALTILRALGLGPAKLNTAPPSLRLEDPFAVAISRALTAAQLWRADLTVDLTRDGLLIKLRLFLPEHAQAERDLGRQRAQMAREMVGEVLRAEGCTSVFLDVLWCEIGQKGWSVLGRAQSAPQKLAPIIKVKEGHDPLDIESLGQR